VADIYVNFPRCPEGMIRGDIDYDLEILMEEGWGTVSGGGAGLKDAGFHVDLELDEDSHAAVDRFLPALLKYLHSLPAPPGTELVICVGDQMEGTHRSVW